MEVFGGVSGVSGGYELWVEISGGVPGVSEENSCRWRYLEVFLG